MSRRHARALGALLGLLALPACIQETTPSDARAVNNQYSLPLGVERVVYINLTGGTYTLGSPNDSQDNVSSVLDVPGPVTLPAYAGTPDQWEETFDCVLAHFAPYNVSFQLDPPQGTHVELVVGGLDEDLEFVDDYNGVAPQRSDCGVVERGIGFVFSDAVGSEPGEVCWAIAHELGHIFGLDHSLACGDIMSYDQSCGPKVFLDEDLVCGTYSARDCTCGPTQNSRQHLLEVLGERSDQGGWKL